MSPPISARCAGAQKPSRPLALAVAAAVVAALGCGAEPVGPHVVLVTIDTLRADRLGSYGYERDTSPHIDRFFSRGTVFEDASSSAPCTIPSVRQYLAGAFDYDVDRKVLAELLHDHGYRTAAVVSQHNFRRALDTYRRGFDHFDIQGEAEVNWNGVTTRDAADVTSRALAWLSENRGGERIFLWVHYFDPHDPYEPPADFREFNAGDASTKHGDVVRYRKDSKVDEAKLFDAEDVAHFRNLYDGEVLFADAEIGRLLEGLDAEGIAENAIVALAADHGEFLWERGRWGHCTSVSGIEVQVPMLMRVNGRPLAGRSRVAEPTSTLDLLPTLTGLLGIEIPGRRLPRRRSARCAARPRGRVHVVARDCGAGRGVEARAGAGCSAVPLLDLGGPGGALEPPLGSPRAARPPARAGGALRRSAPAHVPREHRGIAARDRLHPMSRIRADQRGAPFGSTAGAALETLPVGPGATRRSAARRRPVRSEPKRRHLCPIRGYTHREETFPCEPPASWCSRCC